VVTLLMSARDRMLSFRHCIICHLLFISTQGCIDLVYAVSDIVRLIKCVILGTHCLYHTLTGRSSQSPFTYCSTDISDDWQQFDEPATTSRHPLLPFALAATAAFNPDIPTTACRPGRSYPPRKLLRRRRARRK